MFLDIPDSSAPFSIHNIVTTGVRIGTPIGQFFGPSTLSRALRRICDQWYISRNASISEESNFPATLLEDSSLSKSSNLIDFQSNLTLNELKPAKVSPRKTSKTIDIMHQMPFGYPELIPEIIDDCSIIDARIFPKKDSSVELPKHQKADEKNVPILGVTIWRHGLIRVEALKTAIAGRGPQVLLLPLRLGTYFINEKEYSPLVHASLSCPHSLGVIGGKSKRAFYIVGYQGSSLLYLDPHVIRAAVEVDLDRAVKSREFHCQKVCEMSLKDLDPSVLLCFLCQSPSDVDDVSHMLSTVPLSMPLFSF